MDTLITTPSGDRIRIMGDETAARLLSREHLEETLRKMGQTDLSGWMASAREEELRGLALDFEEEQRAIEEAHGEAA